MMQPVQKTITTDNIEDRLQNTKGTAFFTKSQAYGIILRSGQNI